MRFPEFTGEWEKFGFADHLERLENGANYDTNATEGLPMSRIETISSYNINYDKVGHCNSRNIEHYKMKYGDILFSHINSMSHIGKTAYYYAEQPLYHGMNLLLIRCKDNLNSLFFYYLLNTPLFLRYCQIYAKQAVNQASISTSDIKRIKLSLPTLHEQNKIASFISVIDQRIATQNKIIQHLESLIKGIVVTHFNQCRNKQVITISDLGTAYSVGNLSKEDLSEDGEPCILYGELFTTYGCVAHNIISRTNKYEQATLSQINDLLFPASTTVDAVSLIAPTSIQTHGVYVAGDMFGIHIQPQYDSQYISYLLNFVYNKELAKYAQGSTIIHLHYSDIKRARILVPLLDEQKKCNQLLATLQKKLAAESLVLQMYQSQKQYLLQQMFI